MEKRWFEVWILGYDKDMMCTDVEEFVGEFPTKIEAFQKARSLTIESVLNNGYVDPDSLVDGDILDIEVEEVYEPEFEVCRAIGSWHIEYLDYKE